MRTKKWTEIQLKNAVKKSTSIRQVIAHLGLIAAGGNYTQIKKYLVQLKLDTKHFKGRAWNKGLTGIGQPKVTLEQILVTGSFFQSYKLKKRLFSAGLKARKCEECGWAKSAADGRIPLELHHINGNGRDNRLYNLLILCPNCHSLKPNHRGRNIRKTL